MCHQLPERSFFLFGPHASYSVREIARLWPYSDLPLIWRQFTGSPLLGWKVAWSDRMVSLFSSVLLFAWLWYPVRRRVPALHWLGFIALIMPMAVDGTTHLVSDLQGMYSGFRYTNDWLVVLTQNHFSASFYAGDAIGSFNSWMRLLSGALAGLGVTWFSFPILERYFASEQLYRDARRKLKEQMFQHAFAEKG